MDLMFITNNQQIAIEAEKAGIERIFIDLERNGKYERQGHLDTHIASHTMDDIKSVKSIIKKSEILVRINPYHEKTSKEIDECIKQGADIIMLPMFTTKEEVEKFVGYINGRVKTCLLLETSQAMVRIEQILEVEGIDEIYIGLNDLHLCLGVDFMFEILSEGIVDFLAKKIKSKGIRFGFGGIAKIGEGFIPAELIIGEHYRLGSDMVILSRTFRNEVNANNEGKEVDLAEEIKKIRYCEKNIKNWTEIEFKNNKNDVREKVREVANKIRNNKCEEK